MWSAGDGAPCADGNPPRRSVRKCNAPKFLQLVPVKAAGPQKYEEVCLNESKRKHGDVEASPVAAAGDDVEEAELRVQDSVALERLQASGKYSKPFLQIVNSLRAADALAWAEDQWQAAEALALIGGAADEQHGNQQGAAGVQLKGFNLQNVRVKTTDAIEYVAGSMQDYEEALSGIEGLVPAQLYPTFATCALQPMCRDKRYLTDGSVAAI